MLPAVEYQRLGLSVYQRQIDIPTILLIESYPNRESNDNKYTYLSGLLELLNFEIVHPRSETKRVDRIYSSKLQ